VTHAAGHRGRVLASTGRWDWIGSVADLCRDARLPRPAIEPTSDKNWPVGGPPGRSYPSDWYGEARLSGHGALKLASKGWPAGLAWARGALPAVALPPCKVARRRRVRGDWGDEPDPERAERGEVETMWERTVREAREGARPVALVVQGSVPWSMPADTYRWRCAVPTLLYEALVSAGWNVSAWLVNVSTNVYTNGDHSAAAVEVARADEPCSLDLAVAGFGLAGLMRAGVFYVRETRADGVGVRDGHGHPVTDSDGAAWWRSSVPPALREAVEGTGRAVVLGHVTDGASAATALVAALRELGALRQDVAGAMGGAP